MEKYQRYTKYLQVKRTMNIPERATKEQTEAITQTEGNIRVASVPGSGKTFVLTYRIAYLITELFVEPSSIVALTFTNKAASQMKHRLWKIKNIHWVGLHLIRSRNMSGQKLNCRLFLRLNKNMIFYIRFFLSFCNNRDNYSIMNFFFLLISYFLFWYRFFYMYFIFIL